RIDRALALGGSIELMAFYFGLSSVDVAARRRIAGIDVRPGRGVTLSDEESAELWRLWQKAGITDVESADGLDVMMLAAEQMNIPLT
ncbi:STY4526/YPO1902 family pathogenicity island replication protein, partial [Escherichia coli]